jgi:hypothetical protein
MDELVQHEALEIIERAKARAGLLTILTRRLERSEDLLAKIAAAELRSNPHWWIFTKRITWYDRRRRKIARKRRRAELPYN